MLLLVAGLAACANKSSQRSQPANADRQPVSAEMSEAALASALPVCMAAVPANGPPSTDPADWVNFTKVLNTPVPNAGYNFKGIPWIPMTMLSVTPGAWQCLVQEATAGAFGQQAANFEALFSSRFADARRADLPGGNNGFRMSTCQAGRQMVASLRPLNRDPAAGWEMQVLAGEAC